MGRRWRRRALVTRPLARIACPRRAAGAFLWWRMRDEVHMLEVWCKKYVFVSSCWRLSSTVEANLWCWFSVMTSVKPDNYKALMES